MVAVTETGYELLTPWPNGTGAYPDIEVLPVNATE